MSSSLESLYHQTNRNLQDAHGCFIKLESNLSNDELHKEIYARINRIFKDMERLEVLVHKEPVHRRQNAKIRVDQLKYDVQHLQSSLNSLKARKKMYDREAENRSELLNMKFTTNAAAAGQSDTTILIDKALDHNDSLRRSNKGVDDLISQGSAILDNLRDQREMMKGFQKKILDIASTMGLSNTVIRMIENRGSEDKYILLGGMIVTLLIVFWCLWYY